MRKTVIITGHHSINRLMHTTTGIKMGSTMSAKGSTVRNSLRGQLHDNISNHRKTWAQVGKKGLMEAMGICAGSMEVRARHRASPTPNQTQDTRMEGKGELCKAVMALGIKLKGSSGRHMGSKAFEMAFRDSTKIHTIIFTKLRDLDRFRRDPSVPGQALKLISPSST